jgi:hypothetical protein
MRNVSDQVVEEIKSKFCAHFFFQNRAVYGIMWENVVQSDRPQMAL